MSKKDLFNLNPKRILTVELENNSFAFENKQKASVLLKIFINSKNIKTLFTEPLIKIKTDQNEERVQYLPRRIKDFVYLDLSWPNPSTKSIKLEINKAQIEPKAELLYFDHKDQIDQGTTLIIAPHPDDGELCCTSFYGENSYLVTISAGERIKDLKKQYFTEMDHDLNVASLRKGTLRAFNSVTTGLLGGIKASHMFNLGYLDGTISDLEQHRDKVIKSNHDHEINAFRKFNPQELDFLLPNPTNKYQDLVTELTRIIQKINPTRIVVTNPNLDSHQDHAAVGKILLELLDQIPNQVRFVYLYSVHIKREKPIYFGPALNHIGLPYITVGTEPSTPLSYRSFELNEEQQKNKTIMLNLMYDVYKDQDHRHIKCPSAPYINSSRIGKAYYFQRFVKQNEVFLVIEK